MLVGCGGGGRAVNRAPSEKIVFISDDRLYSMNPDGSDVVCLEYAYMGWAPKFAKDSSKAVYCSWIDDPDVYMIDIADQSKIQLTHDADDEICADISPSGGRLVFKKSYEDADGFGQDGIFILNMRTHEETLIHTGFGADEPRFGPDGQSVVFCSGEETGCNQVCTMRPSGSGFRRLTNTGEDCSHPVYSPDSRKIAFAGSTGKGDTQIYIMNSDGSNLTKLTNIPTGICDYPSFSPDGRQIAFAAAAEYKNSQIFTMDIDGKNLKQITTMDGYTPTWGRY